MRLALTAGMLKSTIVLCALLFTVGCASEQAEIDMGERADEAGGVCERLISKSASDRFLDTLASTLSFEEALQLRQLRDDAETAGCEGAFDATLMEIMSEAFASAGGCQSIGTGSLCQNLALSLRVHLLDP
jgi:hypothetical protein